jgi:hypothetical protein
MSDEMFFTPDMRALRRGKRVASRTETCRPCLLWEQTDQETKHYGVVLDVNPYGMRVRMLDMIAVGTPVVIQMMRDEEYRFPLAKPIEALVVRHQEEADDMVDHGMQISQKKEVQRIVSKPAQPEAKVAEQPKKKTRMYTLDVTVGDRRQRGTGR